MIWGYLGEMLEMIAETTKLDAFDVRILTLLTSDGRMSVQQVSDHIGLSPTPTARRIRRLERDGIITGYGAMIDEAALGFEVSVFVSVQLDRQVDDALVRFEAAMHDFPEVMDCWLMTGDRDYLLRIVTTGLKAFERVLVERLTKVPGVASIQSSIPLRRVKGGVVRTPLPYQAGD